MDSEVVFTDSSLKESYEELRTTDPSSPLKKGVEPGILSGGRAHCGRGIESV
jgi:hypothetical protein